MKISVIGDIADVCSATPIVTDVQSALDLIATIGWEHKLSKAVVNKEALSEDFFDLSTRLAGDVVQKFVNYRWQLAIYGDFSCYTSKALHAFMSESNRGRHLFFVKDRYEAVEMLRAAASD